MKAEAALQKMADSEKVDFDVKFYAERALKLINTQ